MIKVFLDDERTTPKGWVRAYTVAEALELLKSGRVGRISLDNDLGEGQAEGRVVLDWIEEAVAFTDFLPPIIDIHSANPAARRMMFLARDSIDRFVEQRLEQARERRGIAGGSEDLIDQLRKKRRAER